MTKQAKNVQTTLHIDYCKDASGIGLWRQYLTTTINRDVLTK